jgi:hypothetical protein
VPNIDVSVPGGMVQLLAMPESGDRLIFASFMAGQIGMLDISDPNAFAQKAVVNLGVGAGPHDVDLSEDGSRLVVTDYFLDEDDFGKIHFEGDHKVHVIQVSDDTLTLDTRFELDFNTAFEHPARPHGCHEVVRAGDSDGRDKGRVTFLTDSSHSDRTRG